MRHYVQCEEFGPVDRLRLVEGDDLEPGADDVVIGVEAAGVNFVDALLVQGRYQVKPALPFVPGSEVAGTVLAVGANVSGRGADGSGVVVGDRVLALPPRGGYSNQVAVPHASTVAIPAGLSAGQAAGLVQSYATMYYALTRRTTITTDEWVVVLGAGGGIGLAAVDVAAALGARVVACASTDDKLRLARAAGATETINYEETGVDLKSAIREITAGGADLVCDPVGADKAEPALRAVRWGGRYLVIGFAGGSIPHVPLNLVLLNSRSLIGIEWGAWVMRDPAGNNAMLAEIFAMIERGTLHPVEPEARPLADAASVLSDIEQRRVVGKVVLTP